jgi:hypothetical protein
VALIAASAAWRYRGAMSSGAPTAPSVSKPFEFDNGTVREQPAPASAVASSRPGGLRKCVRGNEVAYTDKVCAPGFREKPVASDRVSLVASPAAAPPTTLSGAASQSAGPALLRDKLDLSQDARLRDKVMERAIESNSK